MAFLFNEGSRGGVPLAFNFMVAGGTLNWGTNNLLGMGDVTCRAEPLNGQFSVSELRTSFSDTNGSIWGSLGHGTGALGSSWQATVYVGGNMQEAVYGPSATRLERLNAGGAGTYVIHTGRIVEISRRNRTVDIISRNAMGQIGDLEWQFPISDKQIADQQNPSWNSRQGSNFFFNQNLISGYTSNFGSAYFNVSTDKTYFETYLFVGTASSGTLQGVYPTPAGRGTLGTLPGFSYPGTQFYYDYDRLLFKGTFLATFRGTISDEDQAHAYGYNNLQAANLAATNTVGGGSEWCIMRSRLTLDSNEAVSFPKGSGFFLQQAGIFIEATPAIIWKELITGCCVTPLFGSETIDGGAYAQAKTNTAFQSYSQRIHPKGGKVAPYLKDLLNPLRALWSVSSSNTFRLYTFGPKTFADILGTIGMNEVMSSEVSSSIDNKFNRISLQYGYVFDTGSFNTKIEVKSVDWGSTNDYPLAIQSQWINNPNDADITLRRIIRRFSRGVPKLNVTVPLSRLGADVGSLYAVVDNDLYTAAKAFEVIGWNKAYADSRTIRLEMWDGEALYAQKGYAKWEHGTLLTEVVSGTSLSGWGTMGTVNNINLAFYGSVFSWF